jgi:hypothetical protein
MSFSVVYAVTRIRFCLLDIHTVCNKTTHGKGCSCLYRLVFRLLHIHPAAMSIRIAPAMPPTIPPIAPVDKDLVLEPLEDTEVACRSEKDAEEVPDTATELDCAVEDTVVEEEMTVELVDAGVDEVEEAGLVDTAEDAALVEVIKPEEEADCEETVLLLDAAAVELERMAETAELEGTTAPLDAAEAVLELAKGKDEDEALATLEGRTAGPADLVALVVAPIEVGGTAAMMRYRGERS